MALRDKDVKGEDVREEAMMKGGEKGEGDGDNHKAVLITRL